MKMEDKMKQVFLKRVLEDMEEDRGDDIHVSDLVYDCLRRPYYARKEKEFVEDIIADGLDEHTLLTFWIGKKVHEMSMSDEHEVPVMFGGVVGRIDEIVKIGNKEYIVDKKTVRREVKNAYSHHIKQIEYYSALLFAQTGREINDGMIIYIDVNNCSVNPIVVKLEKDKAKLLLEIENKYKTLKNALEKDILPKACPSWLCNYCRYFSKCIRDEW